MQKQKKKIAVFSPIAVLVFLFLCHSSVYGAVAEKQAVTIRLTGCDTDAGELRIIADENINDNRGNALLKEGEHIQADFVREGDICTAQAALYPSARYYVSDGISKAAFTAEDTQISVSLKETAAPKPATSKLSVRTKASKAAAQDGVLKCVVSSLSSAQDVASDTFLLQCEVPEGAVLDSVYTGSYSADVKLDLLCRTLKDGQWHLWKENISSAKGQTYQTDDISLAQGDRISSFAISTASAPEGFCLKEEDPCYYYVTLTDAQQAESYGASVKVTAYLDGEKSSDKSSFASAAVKIVQTGDDNILFIASVIAYCLSVITLVSYLVCRVVFYKREEAVSHMRLPVRYAKGQDQSPHEKMSNLLEKKPG